MLHNTEKKIMCDNYKKSKKKLRQNIKSNGLLAYYDYSAE